jgi:hypothetical protein
LGFFLGRPFYFYLYPGFRGSVRYDAFERLEFCFFGGDTNVFVLLMRETGVQCGVQLSDVPMFSAADVRGGVVGGRSASWPITVQ